MCNYCYHNFGRTKMATKCPHTDRFVYAKGMCQPCYTNEYYMAKQKRDQKAAEEKAKTLEELDDRTVSEEE